MTDKIKPCIPRRRSRDTGLYFFEEKKMLTYVSAIALEYEDFGELRDIFTELIGREPKEENYGV